ncbi:hypothetical protein D3C78_1895860 [compost metagenome]
MRTWLSGVGIDSTLASVVVDVISTPGLAFYLAAVVLALAALIGWITARRAERDEVTLV